MTRPRGASGSSRETITTGRYLAAKPRSASQTSPGRGFIYSVQNLLFHGPGAHEIQHALIGQFHDFHDLLPNLFRDFRRPLAELLVQVSCENIHGGPPILAGARPTARTFSAKQGD